MTINLDIIVEIGKIAGALTAIWIFSQKIIKPISSIRKSIFLLERERMESAHAAWNAFGYCPPSVKAALKDLHEQYRSEKQNHLSDKYIENLESLPDYPKGGAPNAGAM